MGLSSIFNPDILIGMGQGHEKYQQNLISEEAARRKEMHSTLSHLFDAPNITPEAQDEILRQISEGTQAPLNKPYKYDLNKVTQVRPRIGGSVAPSQTMNVQAPGSTSTVNTRPESMSIPDLLPPGVQGPQLPQKEESRTASVPMQMNSLPTDLSYTLNAPEAPASYRRSGFYSPEEMDTRKLDAYREQQQVLTEEDIKRKEAQQKSEYDWNTNLPKLPAPHKFSSSPLGIFDEGTGDIVHPAPDKPEGSQKSLQESEVVLKDGKRAMAFFNPDPAKAGWYTKDQATGKLIDITDKVAGQYRPPPNPSATIQMQGFGNSIVGGMDQDLGYALDRATNNLTPGRKLAVMSTVQRMVKNNDLSQARATIKQAAAESEPPTVQANITGRREAVAALRDIKSLLAKVPQNLLVGTIEDTARALGTTTNKDMVKLATRLTTTLQSYRKAVTGAQFSAQESDEYARVFPNYKSTMVVNQATLDALMDAFNSRDSIYWSNKLGPGWSDADTLTPPSPQSGGGTKVNYNGQDYTFPNQAAADGFKREMGIK